MSTLIPPFAGVSAARDYGDEGGWSEVTVDGLVLPGYATLTGQISRKLDLKRAPGASGASLQYLGYEPARFDVLVRLWTDEHLEGWEFFAALLQPRPARGKPKAVEVVHPALSLHGIRRAFVERMSLLVPSSQAKGAYEARISFIEARPLTTQNASSTPTSKAALPTENALTDRLKPAGAREAARPSSNPATKAP